MKNLTRSFILGGLTVVGLAVAGYRAYEIKRIRSMAQENERIEIGVEVQEASQK